jgi:hypothetical protein
VVELLTTAFVAVAGLTVLLACAARETVVKQEPPSGVAVGPPETIAPEADRDADLLWLVMPVGATRSATEGRAAESKQFWGLFACYRTPASSWPQIEEPICKLARVEGDAKMLNWPGAVILDQGRLEPR